MNGLERSEACVPGDSLAEIHIFARPADHDATGSRLLYS